MSIFDVWCKIRGVLYPLLFSVGVNDMIQKLCDKSLGCYVDDVYCGCVMYADDLILVSASVNLLQRKIDACCEEAVYLDMKFNALKNVNAQSVSLWESEVKFMFKCRHRIRVYVTLPCTVDREYWLMTHRLIAGNSAV